ncbi:MAG: hypothetical protein M1837_004442 [Sclerophora amabilis]|nr:MAG: hypothetical protein M1837_004442 [Sclerophora amabilis]
MLTPGGRVMLDVPVPDIMIAGRIIEKVAREQGVSLNLLYHRDWISSEDSLVQLFRSVGLLSESVFVTKVYETTEYNVDDPSASFNKFARYAGVDEIRDARVRENIKLRFIEAVQRMAGPAKKLQEDVRFYVGIGRKPT